MTPPLNIADLRLSYTRATLDERDAHGDPFQQFTTWFQEAMNAQVVEPNAMTLATADTDGQPSARIVLLKGFDSSGFVFFTDYRSRKGDELSRNPKAALCFHWAALERQVRIVGTVEQATSEESAKYFHTRPEESRMGAWASRQSSVIAHRDELEAQLEAVKARFSAEGNIPLPPHWGGYRVVPKEIEFWQGRQSRLHDRIRYRLDAEGAAWIVERLSP